ncbi:hypothetical protein [Parabacteroides sp. PF5-6]|uniref:LVIVD repeat-containing protein n=1 Tax=Parabacteroides sp. PF5-6 TaxID=1742403 RepID=UPI0024056135|nr:hypothetical protein [Parabacteroides sp. PF5-6]MDF9829464.1 hypothetical protein [Parabacteroides sp. PF5-6]
MKRIIPLFLAFTALFLSGCFESRVEKVEYTINEPVTLSVTEFRNSVKVNTTPRTIEERGKLCLYNGYLYISEPEVGIHIIDNRNPANPQSVGFIELMGNADVSIRNDRLYADSYIDLVWFDLTNPAKPQLINRLEGVFPFALPPTENDYGCNYNACHTAFAENQVVVGWKPKKRVEWVERYNGEDMMMPEASQSGDFLSNSSGGMSTGVVGSMSRFGLYDSYLYVVMNSQMTIFNLAGDEPVKVRESFYVNQDVETIFPYKDYLFLGTPTGMAIYSVANPEEPGYISTVWHIFGCDPVVVENDLAYVTIHSDNWCGQNVNQLLIIDVSDVYSPNHLVTYSMKKPKGLGIDNGTLFVCDDGLQVFKVGDPQQLMANRLVHYSGMEGYDCIPYNNVLMMIADDGLYQYDYTDLSRISKLSHLKIGK